MRAFTHITYAFTHTTLIFPYIYIHGTYHMPHAHAAYSSGRWPLSVVRLELLGSVLTILKMIFRVY
jgi:hypothetical protein